MGSSRVRWFTLYSMWAWETDKAEEAAISRRAEEEEEMQTMMMRF